MKHKNIFAEGELLVTSSGSAVVNEVLPRSVLESPEIFISVEFDPDEPCPPPCGSDSPDDLDWELFLRTVHSENPRLAKFTQKEELRLKIIWTVSTARTILWKIYIPE